MSRNHFDGAGDESIINSSPAPLGLTKAPQMSYSLHITELIKLQRLLKKLEKQFYLKNGPNRDLGAAAEWGTTPRSGAKWSFSEFGDLMVSIKTLRDQRGDKLDLNDIVHLAWKHGRSATAVQDKLFKERKYYTNFKDEHGDQRR